MQATIAKVGFLTSLTSYLVFWLADAMRPGFVARYFSVHIFLLATILFGVWWSYQVDEYYDQRLLQVILAILFGIFLSVITWRFGEGFGGLRLLVAMMSLVIPLLVLRLVRCK